MANDIGTATVKVLPDLDEFNVREVKTTSVVRGV